VKKLITVLTFLVLLPLLSGCGISPYKKYKGCSDLEGKGKRQCELVHEQEDRLLRIDARNDLI